MLEIMLSGMNDPVKLVLLVLMMRLVQQLIQMTLRMLLLQLLLGMTLVTLGLEILSVQLIMELLFHFLFPFLLCRRKDQILSGDTRTGYRFYKTSSPFSGSFSFHVLH